MSTVVAIVKSIVGQVIAVSPEGIRRVLIEGDRLLAGEQVDTGTGGAVTLELADGRWVKGFICEPYALDGARDITSFGGWRAYIASTKA